MKFFLNNRDTITRYTLITLLCLIIVHLMSYNKLPFSVDYKFPMVSFLVILSFGLILCSSNHLLVNKINVNAFYSEKKQQHFFVDFIFHFVITTIVYTILYIIINQVVFGFDFILVNYFKYLFISLLIILFEYVFRKALLTTKEEVIVVVKDEILIKNGSKLLRPKYEAISCFQSSGGIVTIFLNQFTSEKTTQFTSLKQLDEVLPKTIFFKVNRQFIVNKNAIKTVKNDVNRKLRIEVKPSTIDDKIIELNVSRYLNSEFKAWYSS
ncbi:LytTR family DNA-binding domain-containing protein [Ichthyenterobacterium magnum]|uniref:LytTr DNA-binding domain-containing protein n=1 Tax=Ichthyenterobacterium magnum TaxID=1230530 RepID=A0A420DUT9_9FLAO|nr:LytTR family DNA-binding domain-containing protein [Ichthyenterobacterium magnum]RKE98032.1 LytTr DNA-binding domain-containing protein [Ichthyenterobacterium magnum]